MTAMDRAWLRAYAMLALRIDRRVTADTGGTVLIYRGPDEWSAEVAGAAPPSAGQLVQETDRLLDTLPFDPPRGTYLASQVTGRPAGETLDDRGGAPPAQRRGSGTALQVLLTFGAGAGLGVALGRPPARGLFRWGRAVPRFMAAVERLGSAELFLLTAGRSSSSPWAC